MDRIHCVSSSLILLLFASGGHCNPPTLRETSNGPVKGIQRISSLGQKYYAFEGIPYAEAPITGTDPYTGEWVDRRFKVIGLISFFYYKIIYENPQHYLHCMTNHI